MFFACIQCFCLGAFLSFMSCSARTVLFSATLILTARSAVVGIELVTSAAALFPFAHNVALAFHWLLSTGYLLLCTQPWHESHPNTPPPPGHTILHPTPTTPCYTTTTTLIFKHILTRTRCLCVTEGRLRALRALAQ